MAKIPIYEGLPLESDGEDSQFHLHHDQKGAGFGQRHVQVLMLTWLNLIQNSCNVSMPIILLAMTDPTTSTNKDIPTYNWTKKNAILSSYMWGIAIPQLATGWLVSSYGPKWFLVGSMTLNSIMGMTIPILASAFGENGVLVCRLFQGLIMALVSSASYVLLGKWIPACERSRTTAFLSTGELAGGLVALLLSGYLAAGWYGWPMPFYLYNASGLIWSLLFALIGANCPSDHPTVTREERLYIGNGSAIESRKLSTPWKKILTSPCFWAIVGAQCSFLWGCNTLFSEIPIYMKYVMEFDIKANATFDSSLVLSKWISSFIFCFTADLLINRNILSTGGTRKIMNAVGSLVPCICLILLGNSRPDQLPKFMALLILAVAFIGASNSGHLVNYLDISPNHSGTINGMSNQFAMTISGAVPLVVDCLVSDETNPEQWKYVFYLASGVYAVTAVFFGIFASGQTQSWNDEIQIDEDVTFSETTDMNQSWNDEKRPCKNETNKHIIP